MRSLPVLLLLAASACSPSGAPRVEAGRQADSEKIARAILGREAMLPRERNPTCLDARTSALALDEDRRRLRDLLSERPADPKDAALVKSLIKGQANPHIRWRRPGTSIAYDWEAGVPLSDAENMRLDSAAASIIRSPPQPSQSSRIESRRVPWALRGWGRWGMCASTLKLTAPAFRDDLAFVESSYVCGGLCGYGWLYALRREGAEWKIVATALTWVS